MRKQIHKIIEASEKHNDASHYFDIFIIALILLNVLSMIFASVESINQEFLNAFSYFELVSVIIFTLEYLIRVWTCVENEKYQGNFIGRLKFVLTAMSIIDLLAILPFYLPLIGIDLRFLRILRLFRVFRILKMARYSNAFDMIKNVLKNKKEELVVTMTFIIIILIIISTLMYYVEKEAQPEVFGSIPQALWWGVVTLTTVGYGDMYPITTIGKLLGGLITILGIGLIALPSGIIASGYTEQILRKKDKSEEVINKEENE